MFEVDFNKKDAEALTIRPFNRYKAEEPIYFYKVKGDKMLLPYAYAKEHYGYKEAEKKIEKEVGNVNYGHFPDPYHPSAPEGQPEFMSNLLNQVVLRKKLLVSAATGTGKTTCALNTIARMSVKALVVVPTNRLIDQWVSECKKKLNLTEDDVGVVKRSSCDFQGKKIMIASLKSLVVRDYGESFYDYFGMVVYDECHRMAANKMSQVFWNFDCTYQMAMSATVNRRDNKDKLLKLWFGKYVLKAENIETLKVFVRTFKYEHSFRPDVDEREVLIPILAKDDKRNEKLSDIIFHLHRKNNVILGISDSVKQLQSIYNKLIEKGVSKDEIFIFVDQLYTGDYRCSFLVDENVAELKTTLLNEGKKVSFNKNRLSVSSEEFTSRGKVSKFLRSVKRQSNIYGEKIYEERKKVRKDEIDFNLTNPEVRIYLATYGVMSAGIDIPWINTGIDLTPRVEAVQVIGRIRRKYKGKSHCIWYTPIDVKFSEVIDSINKARMKDYLKAPNTFIKPINRK